MSSPAPPNPVPTRGRRGRLLLGAAVILIAAGIGGYFLFRSPPPPIPEIDLSKADPEVASAVSAAIGKVKADPRDGSAWGKLGMVLRAHDFDMPSVEAFRVAEQFDPTSPKWPYLEGLTLVLFDPDAGLACLQRAAQKASEYQPEPRLRLAEALLDRGKIEEAEAAAVRELGRSPDDPRAGMILARVAVERGDWSAVLTRTEPLRNDPSARKRSAMMRADALRRLGRVGDADTEAARAEQFPEDATWNDRFVQEVLTLRVGGDVELDRGRDLLRAGSPREAAEILEDAVRKSRNPIPARLLLSRALNEARNPAAARRVIDEILQTDPNAVEAWFQRGVSQLLTKDNAGAVESFERVVKLKSDHTLGYFNLGLARKELGDRPGAEAAFEAALRCRPDYEPARQALSELRGGK